MTLPPSFAFLGGAPGGGEWIVLFVVILVLFGPRRLPQIARSLGKALEYLRRASHDFKDQIMSIDETEPEKADDVDGTTVDDEDEGDDADGGDEDTDPVGEER